LAKLGFETYATLHTGLPISALTRGAESLFDQALQGEMPTEEIKDALESDGADKIKKFAKEHEKEAKGIIRPKKAPETPPQMIHALRDHFESLLRELDVTLVVFVDDLDRCLPPTVIGTLEAMRLFLFMDRTAFVIAADEKMIKEAVRIHFTGAKLDDDLVVSYFDKLIQVPLRVPPLGINEARAYLMLLFIDDSSIPLDDKIKVADAVSKRLGESWKGETVTSGFVEGLIPNCPSELKAEFAVADRLAKQMVTSRRISGNPRLIKRFLNTLSIRRKLAKIYGITVDDDLLAKVLLFERCATRKSFEFLVETVNHAVDGKPARLKALEKAVKDGHEPNFEGFDSWKADETFVTEWLKLDPPLGDVDLRGALHVGRESLPVVAEEDRVSKAAIGIANEMLALRLKDGGDLKTRFANLILDERKFVTDKLLERAATESSWGTPDILWGLALAADADKESAKQISDFLSDRPTSSLSPSIVMRIRGTEWGREVCEEWVQRSDLPVTLSKVLASKPKEKA
jgi:predicted KAP-like P-loop ATPase